MIPPQELVQLSRDLGQSQRKLAIIGEGNTSMRADDQSFWVKASGQQLSTITSDGFALIRFDPILDLFEHPPDTISEQRAALRAARVDGSHGYPSVETSFHAMLLQECHVQCIAHTHPVAVNRLLCSAQAGKFATTRTFPDEIVICGPESVFVPYVDPGLSLAITIRQRVQIFMGKYGEAPKVILLANHGLIALGQTPNDALNITLMADKAAEIYWGAVLAGGVSALSTEEILHIYRRPDEIYRRQMFADQK